jgi:K+ potassium transporter integral membrane domain
MPAKPAPENSENQEKLEPVAPEEKKEVSAGNLLKLILLSLGVVFGDIAINPPFTILSCFQGRYAIQPSQANIFKVGSLIFWSLSHFGLPPIRLALVLPGFAIHPPASLSSWYAILCPPRNFLKFRTIASSNWGSW